MVGEFVKGRKQFSRTRFESNQFTDTDIKLLLISLREKTKNKLIRELGDFIAHPERDRGATRNHIIIHYADMARWVKYGIHKHPFPTDGSCDWWLKAKMLNKIQCLNNAEIKEKTGKRKPIIKERILSYFPNEPYPTRLIKNFDRELADYCALTLSTIEASKPLFSKIELMESTIELIKELGLPITSGLQINLIIGMCVALHGVSIKLPNGQYGICNIGEDRPTEDEKIDEFHPFRRNLELTGYFKVPWQDDFLRIAMPILRTGIDLYGIIDSSLIEESFAPWLKKVIDGKEVVTPCIPKFTYNFDQDIQFDASLNTPIFATAERVEP